MIVLFTHAGDLTAQRVARLLAARRAPFLLLDPAELQQGWWVTVTLDAAGRRHAALCLPGQQVALADVRSAWWRRPGKPTAPAHVHDPRLRQYLEDEARQLAADLWLLLRCAWLPGPPAQVFAMQHKLQQLERATALGFEIPPTLLACTPEAVLEFHEAHRGRIVSKLYGPTAFGQTLGETFVRYTEPVTRRDLRHVHAVKLCPVLLQAYVDKQVELRVTVVGQRVFAAEIDSQRSNHTRLDWRKYDHQRHIYRPHALPAQVQARCLALTRDLGLSYSAIDLVLTPDGRHVFLETNPAGEFGWIQERTGLPIGEAIADFLIEHDADEEPEPCVRS